MAYSTVALEPRTRARMLVTWWFEHRGEWIERLPMPRTGWAKDRNRWRADRRRNVHQPGIIRYSGISRCKRKDRVAQIGAGEIPHTISTGGHDFLRDGSFIGPAQHPDRDAIRGERAREFRVVPSRPCLAGTYGAG